MITENVLQKPIRRAPFFRYAPLLLWTCVVLSASSNQASMDNTSHFISPLLHFLFPTASEETIYLYHHYIRKLAHLTEYSILAFWAFRVFVYSTNRIFQKNWFFFSIGYVALVASIDEIHQSFVPSRGSSIYDVMLDVFGGLILLSLIAVYRKFKN